MLRGMGACGGVSQQAIAEAAELVAEKIDVLLERATDVVMGAPRAGSPQWKQAWASRDTDAGRAEVEHRARVKIAIAEAAGVGLSHELERSQRAGMLTRQDAAVTEAGKRRRTSRIREASPARAGSEFEQLAIW